MFPRIGRLLLFRAAVVLLALTGFMAAQPNPFPTASAAHLAGAIRLASSTGVIGGSTPPGVPGMQVDFVDVSHGFGLNPVPAINDGGFAASPSLLLSTVDGGKNWKSRAIPVSDGQVSAISFVSATSGWAVSFISLPGSSQRPAILATTDAGANWASEALPSSVPGLILFDVNFVDAQHGWAGGMDGDASGNHPIVLATVDGGQSWSPEALPASLANGRVNAMSFSSDTVGRVIGETPTGPFIIGTSDGGMSWTAQPVPTAVTQLTAVTTLGSNAWAVGLSTGSDGSSSGVAIKSQNGGGWQTEATPPSLGLFDVAFSSSANGWAVGVGTGFSTLILHTKNGGATWSPTGVATPVPEPSAVATVAGAGAWVIGSGTCGLNAAVAKTTDGATWVAQLAMPPTPARFGPASFPTGSTGFMITQSCGYHLLRSTDGGRTWVPTAPFPAVIQATALAFPTRSHGWVVGDTIAGSVIYTTADGAASWIAQTLPSGFNTFGPLGFGDSMHGWILGEDQNFNAVIVGTSDGGKHWLSEAIPSRIGYLSAVAAVGSSNVWAVGSTTDGAAVVIASNTGGASWSTQPIPTGLQSLQQVTFVDTLHGWAVGNDAAFNSAMLATSDGGASWQRQPNAPANVREVSFASASVGWALGGQSLFATSNGGSTWTQQTIPSLLPYPNDLQAVSTLTVIMEGTNQFEVPGIARSSNGGSSWSSAAVFDPAWLSVSPTSGSVGSTITLSGHGFAAGEAVKVRWTSTQGTTLATVTSDSNGGFTVSFAVPSTTAGAHKVYAVGQLSLSAPYVSVTVA